MSTVTMSPARDSRCTGRSCACDSRIASMVFAISSSVGGFGSEVFGAVLPLVHRARRLSRTEPGDACFLVVPLEHAVDLAGDTVGVDLDLEDHLRARLARDGVTERSFRGSRGRGGRRAI